MNAFRGINKTALIALGLLAMSGMTPSCSGESGPVDAGDDDETQQDSDDPACTAELDSNDLVEFGFVRVGEKSDRDVILFNRSACPVAIRGFSVSTADPVHVTAFSISVDGDQYTPSENSEVVEFPGSLAIEPSSGVVWKVSFSPNNDSPVGAMLMVFSDDSEDTDPILAMPLSANDDVPRMDVLPDPIEFGGKLVGKTAGMVIEIKSTGTRPIEISGITLDESTSADFALQLDFLESVPTPESPTVLQPGDKLEFNLLYTPDSANPVDEFGDILPDTGLLMITNTGILPSASVPLIAYGVMSACPVPVIVIEEGEEVPPDTTLHLHGSESHAAFSGDTIKSYSWSVNQPDENSYVLVPTQSSPDVTHVAEAPGSYRYCLDVCDSNVCTNDPTCGGPTCKTVQVLPETAIRCELTWNTPADLDQYDEGENKGADMDLHFAHPFAATEVDFDEDGAGDPWFDELYDVFALFPYQDWETPGPDPSDNPILDRDDSDGAGPETLILDAPADGRVYSLGVHYYDDHGFGISYPRIRCYIFGQLRFDYDLEIVQQPLHMMDMWYVGKIYWPQQTIELLRNPDNSPIIMKNYPVPLF